MCCFHIYYRYYKNVTTGIVLQRKEVVNFFLSHFLLHLFLPQKNSPIRIFSKQRYR
jgi:hypothetical protein